MFSARQRTKSKLVLKAGGSFLSSFKKKSRHAKTRHLKAPPKKINRIFPLLLILILLFVGGMAVAYLHMKPFFLRPMTQKVFSWIQHRVEAKGIQASVLEFEDVHWKFPDRIFWKNVSLRVHSASGETFPEGLRGVLWAREAEIRFPRLFWGEVRMVVRGGFFAAISDPEKEYNFFADQCQLTLRVPWWPPDLLRSRLGRLFNEVCRVLKDGKTCVPIRLSGRIAFQIFGKQETARIWLAREGSEYRLVMNPDDLRRISEGYIEKVSDPEIEVLSRHPLWISKAMRITDEARAVSQEAFINDKDVPEDAFRHVWWSYHLTKAFGPEFSKELTDAHEKGSETNTEADHIMDNRNNQIGRDYALQDYPEGSLLERTMKDPDIFCSTGEVYREGGIPDTF